MSVPSFQRPRLVQDKPKSILIVGTVKFINTRVAGFQCIVNIQGVKPICRVKAKVNISLYVPLTFEAGNGIGCVLESLVCGIAIIFPSIGNSNKNAIGNEEDVVLGVAGLSVI
jgi:hypothetical protein